MTRLRDPLPSGLASGRLGVTRLAAAQRVGAAVRVVAGPPRPRAAPADSASIGDGGRRPMGRAPARRDDDRDRRTTMTAPATTGPQVDRLVEDDRAQDDRDDRVDVGVRRHERQRRDAQQPAVDA